MATEGRKLQGTSILTTTTLDAVKSAEQMASEQNSATDSKSSGSSTPSGIGGLLAKRLAQRKSNDDAANGPKDRATVLTTSSEVLKVATAVTPDEVSIPAGFKESK